MSPIKSTWLIFILGIMASGGSVWAQVPSPTPPCVASCPNGNDDLLCGAPSQPQACGYDSQGRCVGQIVCSSNNSLAIVPCAVSFDSRKLCRQINCEDLCKSARASNLVANSKCTGGEQSNCGSCLCKSLTTTAIRFISCES